MADYIPPPIWDKPAMVSRADPALLAAFAPPPKAPVVRTVVSFRQPSGHTHTCPVDGETWDHAKNPTHDCPRCGRQQLVVDQPSRMVQVRTVTAEPKTQFEVNPPPIAFSLPQSSSACGPGGCPTSGPTYPLARWRLFR